MMSVQQIAAGSLGIASLGVFSTANTLDQLGKAIE